MKFDGVRVLDLSRFLPGPTASLMMADQGAEVIKIETLDEGEPNRQIGQRRGTPPDDVSVYFDCTHRGKKSLTLNLKAASTWRRPAPAHGADTDAILAQLGLDAAERARLREAGVC